jgi:hypothetical protein
VNTREQIHDFVRKSTENQLGLFWTSHSIQKLEAKNIGVRILKYLVEAEKSTFPEELSFQRSESTIGLLQATVFVYDRKSSFSVNFTDLKK